MVFPLPWNTRFTTKELKSRAFLVWLELFDLHPGLMKFGLNMLQDDRPGENAQQDVGGGEGQKPNEEGLGQGLAKGGVDQHVLIREVIDLTKPMEKNILRDSNEPRTTGYKHQQEDRDQRLSSIGAITPDDLEGQKKLRNQPDVTSTISPMLLLSSAT
ncbi:hypothetical protein R1sor_009096 [Riccia sorocarpa]|uniref:DUF4283 domain-containing protein n=1 Tax=Riccia sorocarpa TaxID=122646 RepID=A0ABD3H4T9_9MARC